MRIGYYNVTLFLGPLFVDGPFVQNKITTLSSTYIMHNGNFGGFIMYSQGGHTLTVFEGAIY